MIRRHVIKIASTGSAGSASGSGTLALSPFELLGLFIDYNASAPATTDVTFTAIGGDEADRTVLTVSNNATDAWYFPKEQDDDSSASPITGSYSHPVIHRGLLVEIAQADALSPCITVTVLARES